MNTFSNLPPFDLAFADLNSGSLDLIEKTPQFNTSLQTSIFQGMSVQTLNTSFPGYHNQSDLAENNPVSFNFLDKYDIEPLTFSETASATAGFFETDIPDIPTSVLDEYVPEHCGNESVNDAPSIPNISLIQQIYLSGSEPEIREPTPQSHSDPDYPLTNLPDPKDLRPLTIVKPLNLNQTASDNQTPRAKGIVDDNASMINSKRDLYKDPDLEIKRKRHREYMRELRKNPAYVKHQRQRCRERYQNDPVFVEHRKLRDRRYRQNDPDFARKRRAYHRKYQRERYQNDPDFAEKRRVYQREYQRKCYQNDPDFAKRKRNRMREPRKDPAGQNGCAAHA